MSSVLAKVFSSKLVRGAYPDEKPAVDFQMEGSAQERKRLSSMINRVAKASPFGKTVLETAAKGGYTLAFATSGISVAGSCCEKKKTILLNPFYSDSRLLTTLVHESRHAEQFIHGADSDFGKRTVKSELMYFRAMEADAEAAAAVSAYEMKENGDGASWRKFRSESPDMAYSLSAVALNAGRTTDRMLAAAFKGWYENKPIKDAYEESYIVETMDSAMKAKKEAEYPYDREETSSGIVNMVCRGENGCYFKDNPDVLEHPDRLDISASTASKAAHFFAVREMRTGMKPDTSFDKLPVRHMSLPASSPVYSGWGTCYSMGNDGFGRIAAMKKAHGGR